MEVPMKEYAIAALLLVGLTAPAFAVPSMAQQELNGIPIRTSTSSPRTTGLSSTRSETAPSSTRNRVLVGALLMAQMRR